ncbi:hypothetical protein [Rugosimonospora africana]|uniref:Uncharacterized protein n=1 Tax=Rugosimonospora africana TaxID=556532 RepID=A0A8J3QS66_9ACTN|nr:hypothetical protein [Rugosimonospora africana]GIH15903.1 hypothetical protein Raf01_40750 [Rugosimonospora africana]
MPTSPRRKPDPRPTPGQTRGGGTGGDGNGAVPTEQALGGSTSSNGHSPSPGSSVPDLPFPILTKEVASTTAGDVPGDPGITALRRISDTLGWRWRPDDPTAFLAALTNSFAIKRVEGHNELTWTPRGFAVQADLGQVTGGQASLAARVASTVREALPLLDSLVPLLPDADPDDCAAFRGLVRHDLEELRYELASPVLREERIDLLFRMLTAYDPRVGFSTTDFDARHIGGHLGRVRDQFGFLQADNRSVNTLADERIETTFITLSDWVAGLVMSWDSQRQQLDVFAGSGVFLGNTLTVLGGQLAALYDLVDDLESALDSVLIDKGQRQAVRVPGTTLFVDSLLEWVRAFAGSEGKAVIDVGGRDAVETAFVPTVEALRDAARHLLVPVCERGSLKIKVRGDLPLGFRTARVEAAAAELLRTLRITARLARATFRAVLFRTVPEIVFDGEPFEVTVSNFDPSAHAFVLTGPGLLVVATGDHAVDQGGGVWQLRFESDGHDVTTATALEIRAIGAAGQPDRWRVEDHEWIRVQSADTGAATLDRSDR